MYVYDVSLSLAMHFTVTTLSLHFTVTSLSLRVESLVALSHPLVMKTAETAGTMPTALEEEDFLLLVTTLLMRAVATIIIVR